MRYRKFGKLDWMISEVSLGVLRQEEIVADPFEINDPERTEAIRYAIEQGVNYINLGYPLFFDDPEEAGLYVTEALDGGYRKKVKIAINIPSRSALSQQDLCYALNKQLDFFNLDKADFCVVDGVDRTSWDALKSMGFASWVSKAISTGKVDHIGLAFHDDAHYLQDIYNTYTEWAFLQIELSILDHTHHPGIGGLKFAKEYDTAVIATDITKAGRLLYNVPEEVRGILDNSLPKRVLEERCIRWALSLEEISSIQLSVQTELCIVDRVKRYFSYFDQFDPDDVDIWEKLTAEQIREAYYAKRDYQCTACRCCMPCPCGIDAPRIVELINDDCMFADSRIAKFQYNLENHQSIECVQCGICNKLCPKRIPLQEIVNIANEKYANKKGAI